MGRYYHGMKDTLKIQKAFESSDTEEESSMAMKALRPKANKSKFKDLV